MSSLSTAELAIYAILAIPTLYILFKHRLAGALGWFYLFSFCSLRIIGGGLSVNNTSSSASIISSVGLSPLLLSTCGILHEARVYRLPNLNAKIEWIYVLLFHMLVGAGIGILASGASSLESAQATSGDRQMVKVGISLLTVSWVVLLGWAGISVVPLGRKTRGVGVSAAAPREGAILLYAVCVSLAFIGIRVLYALVSDVTGKSYLNPITGSLAIRVVLSFLPELIATLIFIGAGICTRDVVRNQQSREQASYENSDNSKGLQSA